MIINTSSTGLNLLSWNMVLNNDVMALITDRIVSVRGEWIEYYLSGLGYNCVSDTVMGMSEFMYPTRVFNLLEPKGSERNNKMVGYYLSSIA